jgi:hypothetical protein
LGDFELFYKIKKTKLIWALEIEIYGSKLIKTKSYFCSNPDRAPKIQRHGNVFSIQPASARTERPGCHGRRWRRSSSTSYGAWGKTKLLPTRSRRPRGLVLLTFDEANDPWRVSGGGLKFIVFNGGARPRLSFSGFKK